MSRRTNTSRRLETRSQREARQLGSAPRPSRVRNADRRSGSARRRSLPWATIGIVFGIALVAAFIGYLVVQANQAPGQPGWLKAELDASTKLPGVYYPPHPGKDGVFDSGTNPNSDDRQHFANGSVIPICTQEQLDSGNVSNPFCYTTNPPTSGPHAVDPMPFGILNNPAPKENLVHNMEHGGVVVWYNTTDQATIDELKTVVKKELDRGKQVVMSQYTDMEPDTIALTAWTRMDKFPVSDLTDKRVTTFIDAHSRRFNPEGF